MAAQGAGRHQRRHRRSTSTEGQVVTISVALANARRSHGLSKSVSKSVSAGALRARLGPGSAPRWARVLNGVRVSTMGSSRARSRVRFAGGRRRVLANPTERSARGRSIPHDRKRPSVAMRAVPLLAPIWRTATTSLTGLRSTPEQAIHRPYIAGVASLTDALRSRPQRDFYTNADSFSKTTVERAASWLSLAEGAHAGVAERRSAARRPAVKLNTGDGGGICYIDQTVPARTPNDGGALPLNNAEPVLSEPARFAAQLAEAPARVAEQGAWGPLYFVAAAAVAESLTFPVTPVMLTAGYIFGLQLGVAVLLASAARPACSSCCPARCCARAWRS
ncbi:unnamed protein product [Prorocentrum cordatum]|uniref:Uncharacterized protein n=1 Tax=Prorocentrum cordatum TaxID=2364126 RepID=A0ABN9S275_9DINO|nr:unnamed protein product [Polarella glacialis]